MASADARGSTRTTATRGFFLAVFVKRRFRARRRLRLRPFAAADAARLPALCGDLEVSRTHARAHPYGITEARFFLDKVCDGGASSTQGLTLRDGIIQMKRGAGLSTTLAVVKRDGDELIGCVSLDRDNFNETAAHRLLAGAFWRRGHATEAAQLSSPTALMSLGSSASTGRTSWRTRRARRATELGRSC